MATLIITQTLDYLLPNVLRELIIEYYGIKDSIDSNAISMCTHNDILYVLRDHYVTAYDSDLDEVKKYIIGEHMTDLSVDNQYVYTIATNYTVSMEKIKKETNQTIYLSEYRGDCVTIYNDKLYVKSNHKINILCSISGTLLETIKKVPHTGNKIMFRENELFITQDYRYFDTKNLIIINNNHDIYVNMNENKVYLYEKNTLYKKYGGINIPHSDKLISELVPLDAIIIDAYTYKSNNKTLELEIHYTSRRRVKCITASDNKIYVCVEYYDDETKIIVYNIRQNKIQRKKEKIKPKN
jgi:hypothetical protein